MHRLNRLSRPLPICLLLILACFALPAQTIVEKHGDGWHGLVDGQPFTLKGATFGYRL